MELKEYGLYENKCAQCGRFFNTTDKYKMTCNDCDGEIHETYQEKEETRTKERLDQGSY